VEKKENPLIIDLLTLMTSREIENLSYIYHSLNRISLTELMKERLHMEMQEMGFRPEILPPPLFEQKKWEREDPFPAVITAKETRGGPDFILAEREKLKKSNQKLGQLEVLSLYREVAKQKSSEKAQITSLGLLINKISA